MSINRLHGSALILASLASGVLAGCATSYHPAASAAPDRTGYFDRGLQHGQVKVSFAGNEYTSAERVKHFALRRAAEISIAQGYQYFTVSSWDLDRVPVVLERRIPSANSRVENDSYGNRIFPTGVEQDIGYRYTIALYVEPTHVAAQSADRARYDAEAVLKASAH